MTQLFIVTMILVSMAMSHNHCDLTKYIPGTHILVLPVEVVADLRAEVGRQVGVAAVQTVVYHHDPGRTRGVIVTRGTCPHLTPVPARPAAHTGSTCREMSGRSSVR